MTLVAMVEHNQKSLGTSRVTPPGRSHWALVRWVPTRGYSRGYTRGLDVPRTGATRPAPRSVSPMPQGYGPQAGRL